MNLFANRSSHTRLTGEKGPCLGKAGDRSSSLPQMVRSELIFKIAGANFILLMW